MNRKPEVFWDDHKDGEPPARAKVGVIGRTFGTIVKTADGWQAWTPARMTFTGPITPGECIGTYADHLDAARALADAVEA